METRKSTELRAVLFFVMGPVRRPDWYLLPGIRSATDLGFAARVSCIVERSTRPVQPSAAQDLVVG